MAERQKRKEINRHAMHQGAGRQKLRSGYYMFDSRGCLCKRRRFYRVNTVIGSKRFKGTYYFCGDYGSLYRRAGWKTINGYTYLLGFEGKRYENRWKYGYYFNANGKIVKTEKYQKVFMLIVMGTDVRKQRWKSAV